ncbi:MAG: response regulator [Eubacteriales bacterium]|nr:response regulator [Eubacteriales bacterium]
MYKLLIVDDEDLEREGLASLIPWSDYQIQVVGTAWNGIEGLEKIQALRPDIVITDIKMPVMNGIELVRRTREVCPEVRFIVLSGYGEYEYTSQAMELGVRHYLLKPCDEKKLLQILDKVTAEIRGDRLKHDEQSQKAKQMRSLKLRAGEQLFRNVLIGKETVEGDYLRVLEEDGWTEKPVFLLAMRAERRIDYLEQFALTNIFAELLGTGSIALTTAIERDVLYLVDAALLTEIRPVTEKVQKEYERFMPVSFHPMISGAGQVTEVLDMYRTILGMYREEGQIRHDDVKAVREAAGQEELLFELRLLGLRLKLAGYSLQQQKEYGSGLLLLLFGEESQEGQRDILALEDEKLWLERMVYWVNRCRKRRPVTDKEQKRMETLIQAIYQNLGEQELSLQWLAREILFMNEDYVSRLFSGFMNQKYSAYVAEKRIRMAERILQDNPDVRIIELAEELGYPMDGQYFSRTFKKITGKTPSEYRDEP